MARCPHAGRSAQEALADPGRERCAAASARRPGTACDGLRRIRVGLAGEARFGTVAGPCKQWSIGRAVRGTLMRHDVCIDLDLRRRPKTETVMADAPAPRTRRVGHAPATAALVATGRLALRGVARQTRTTGSAVALTAVAAAAQLDLDEAPCAQEQAGGIVHAHPEAPQAQGAGRTRPSEPHSGGTALLGTV